MTTTEITKTTDAAAKKPQATKATKAKLVSKSPAAVRKEAKTKTTKATGKFAGKAIHLLVKDNPRKAGTHGWRSFEIVRKQPGISYEAYIAAGGRNNDLRWDVEHKFAEVK
jgi:hypothetical protein